MALTDIVVDTNVLAHAANPSDQDHFNDASLFLEQLASETTTIICIDPDPSLDRNQNTSRIFGEYLTTLSPAALTASVIAALFIQGRYAVVPRTVSKEVRTKINRLVRKSSATDKVFVSVAYNSTDRVLASHDFTDFPAPVRAALARELAVTVSDAVGCAGLL